MNHYLDPAGRAAQLKPRELQEFKALMFKAYRDEVEGPLPEDMMVIVGSNWELELERLKKS